MECCPTDIWRPAVLCGLTQESGQDMALLRLAPDQYLRVPVPPTLFAQCGRLLGQRVWVDIDGRGLQLDDPHQAFGATAAGRPSWLQGLPSDQIHQVVVPRRFSTHVDEAAHAVKCNGYDAQGRRCWVRHDHTAVAEHFDIDEHLHEVPVQHEHRTAWRLHDGRWLHTLDRVHRLDSCAPAVHNHLALAAREQDLGY